MDKIELKLHPVKGTLGGKGLYKATVETGRGNVMGLDEMVAYAIDRGYICGVKQEVVKSTIRGFFDSIRRGIASDGRSRSIDEYLNFRLVVHGNFEDAHDDFDPKRHGFSLSVAPLRAMREAVERLEAVNIDRKRQFRVYSVKAADTPSCKNRHIVWKRDIAVTGTDFAGSEELFAVLYVDKSKTEGESFEANIVSRTDTDLRIAWPEDLTDGKYSRCRASISIWRFKDPSDHSKGAVSRDIDVCIENPV